MLLLIRSIIKRDRGMMYWNSSGFNYTLKLDHKNNFNAHQKLKVKKKWTLTNVVFAKKIFSLAIFALNTCLNNWILCRKKFKHKSKRITQTKYLLSDIL